MNVRPVTLEGEIVRLEPLRRQHLTELTRIGLVPELWELQPTPVTTPEDMRAYVIQALSEAEFGSALPFVIVHRPTESLIGSTRFADIQREHRRLEIGWTWIIPEYQRTKVNTEMKWLLLKHAFEELKAQKVVLKTDLLNTRSRNAIARIGGVQEGIFRKHVITASGRIRDTVWFGITDDEWPAVQANLLVKLQA